MNNISTVTSEYKGLIYYFDLFQQVINFYIY